jgi:hypothetical protein
MKKATNAEPKRHMFVTDLHYGYELDPETGKRRRIHDRKAADVMLQFARDFRPHVMILGGDILDCHPVSPHNTAKDKPGVVEGLRFRDDVRGCRSEYLEPIEALGCERYVFITGNHEAWINQFTEKHPQLKGILDLRTLLMLDERWELIRQGGRFDLGKLTFVHGDQLSGSDAAAKAACISFERNIRFGHIHTAQIYTKSSVGNGEPGKTGMAVPCLAMKQPAYSKGKPNRWCTGFSFGYTRPGGFSDYIAVIVRGEATINGKTYTGKG